MEYHLKRSANQRFPDVSGKLKGSTEKERELVIRSQQQKH